MCENLQHYIRNLRKKKLLNFVSTVKVSILCSLLLVIIYYANNDKAIVFTIDQDYITKEYPKYPKFNTDINHKGKIFNWFYTTEYLTFLISKRKLYWRSAIFLAIIGTKGLGLYINKTDHKLEHCNCIRKIYREEIDTTEDAGGNDQSRGKKEYLLNLIMSLVLIIHRSIVWSNDIIYSYFRNFL